MKTLGKAIANKIALVLSQYFQLPPGYLMGVIPNHVRSNPPPPKKAQQDQMDLVQG